MSHNDDADSVNRAMWLCWMRHAQACKGSVLITLWVGSVLLFRCHVSSFVRTVLGVEVPRAANRLLRFEVLEASKRPQIRPNQRHLFPL